MCRFVVVGGQGQRTHSVRNVIDKEWGKRRVFYLSSLMAASPWNSSIAPDTASITRFSLTRYKHLNWPDSSNLCVTRHPDKT